MPLTKKYYPHPYLTKSGMIGYKFKSYPCPESKKWKVLDESLKNNITKLYNKVNKDNNSSEELKKKVQDLYDNYYDSNKNHKS
jgi:hypothetical protein